MPFDRTLCQIQKERLHGTFALPVGDLEVFLQRSDLPAYARLTQVECARCSRERVALCNPNKHSKVFQLIHKRFPLPYLRGSYLAYAPPFPSLRFIAPSRRFTNTLRCAKAYGQGRVSRIEATPRSPFPVCSLDATPYPFIAVSLVTEGPALPFAKESNMGIRGHIIRTSLEYDGDWCKALSQDCL
jgi:hypothetical protein